MRKWLYLLTSVAGLAQAAPPARIEVAYELSRDGSVVAEVVEVLEHGGGRYQITETSRGKGLLAFAGTIKRTSRGVADAKGVRPLEYLDERPGRNSRAAFDWQARTISMQHKAEQKSVPMPDGVQDRLSFMLAFALFPPKEKAFTYHVADGRGLSEQRYRVAGREKVKTPAGEFTALKLVRSKEKENTEIWLAAELGYFPVRVSQVPKDGKRLEQTAVRVSVP
ncbi:MAG TPA: DUF3108 domain-containing protein [Burkholderiales bacterium]|mgnify:FL=1